MIPTAQCPQCEQLGVHPAFNTHKPVLQDTTTQNETLLVYLCPQNHTWTTIRAERKTR